MKLYNKELGKLNDFRNCLILVWAFLKMDMPDLVQLDMSKYLQQGPDKLIIQAFRGVGKTWITATFVCWCLLMNPDLKILIVSKNAGKAIEISTFIRKLMRECSLFQHLNPDSPANMGQNTMQKFDVVGCNIAVAPSVKAVGITGDVVGSRANIIIPDDIETVTNSLTQNMRDDLLRLASEFGAVLSPGGRIIYLGTPQTEQTIYSKIEKKGYEIRVWPIQYPSEEQMANPTYCSRLAPLIKDAWLPSKANKSVGIPRFDAAFILAKQAEGYSWFMLQYMLDPTLSDETRYPLKLRDLMFMHLNPDKAPIQVDYAAVKECVIQEEGIPNIGFEGDRLYKPFKLHDSSFVPYDFKVLAIDPSGRGSDETGYAVIGCLKGRLFLLDSGGFQEGYDDEVLQEIANKARDYRVTKIVYESNMGDGMFGKLLFPFVAATHPTSIEEINVQGQKERRILDMLEPVLNQHRLVVDIGVLQRDCGKAMRGDQENIYSLFYQLTRLTKDRQSLKNDDRIDALYLAVRYCINSMSQDVNKSAEEHVAKMRKEHFEKFGQTFRKSLLGRHAKPAGGGMLRR
ncbi:phage terminase large subunit [Rhizobacter sp. Root404]|uniref:phage terminase large subunit n=1 Tax=Rhizobacter sp. Root404 TaxID=1736528 RepID=UPI0006FABC01|nr:phage terminase large subunit [Rhizobacter sp. Root404]KQW36765.1 hypothetical protein ASC76_19200 [Rhizobacter sp. Root404]